MQTLSPTGLKICNIGEVDWNQYIGVENFITLNNIFSKFYKLIKYLNTINNYNGIIYYNGEFINIKHNYNATTNPTQNDDYDNNYYMGSYWYNNNLNNLFLCKNNSISSASWINLNIPTKKSIKQTITSGNTIDINCKKNKIIFIYILSPEQNIVININNYSDVFYICLHNQTINDITVTINVNTITKSLLLLNSSYKIYKLLVNQNNVVFINKM